MLHKRRAVSDAIGPTMPGSTLTVEAEARSGTAAATGELRWKCGRSLGRGG
jgi:hypothetical protein